MSFTVDLQAMEATLKEADCLKEADEGTLPNRFFRGPSNPGLPWFESLPWFEGGRLRNIT